MVLCGHVTNKVHGSTWKRPMDTKLGKVFTYCEKFPPLKPHDSLITWPKKFKYYILIFTRFMTPKFDRILTSGRRFSTKMLRSSWTNPSRIHIPSTTFNTGAFLNIYSVKYRVTPNNILKLWNWNANLAAHVCSE